MLAIMQFYDGEIQTKSVIISTVIICRNRLIFLQRVLNISTVIICRNRLIFLQRVLNIRVSQCVINNLNVSLILYMCV